jgi:hypothetical protein
MAKTSKSASKARSAATGAYVKPGYAKANPSATVIARGKPAKAARPATAAKSRGAAKKK